MLDEQLIEATGHQPGEWVVTKPANYGVEGSQSLYCTVCNALIDTKTIPALIVVISRPNRNPDVSDKEEAPPTEEEAPEVPENSNPDGGSASDQAPAM